MPKYRVTTDQGIYEVTVEDPPVERGGLMSPATSLLAPELEGARSALTSATEAPHGQPIMARSRTGALYPSEEGTGAINAMKASARGAGGALIDQAEGVTSPLGLVAAGATKVMSNPAAKGITGRLMKWMGDFDVTHPFKSTLGKAGEALVNSAEEARMNPPRTMSQVYSEKPTPPTVPELSPSHLDLSQAVRPGAMTQAQIAERIGAVDAAGGLPARAPIAAKPPISISQNSMQTPSSPAVAKASFTAQDVIRIKVLMQSGLSEADAVKRVTAAKSLMNSGSFSGLPSGPDVADSVGARNLTGKWNP